MRIAWTIVILMAAFAGSPQTRAGPEARIDLNEPGAFEALRHTNVEHYNKIVKIIQGLGQRPREDIPGWARAAFGARNVDYSRAFLISYPPCVFRRT